MTPEEQANDIITKKTERFIPKFLNGNKEHGGDFTTMGLYQAVENAENEIDDLDAYLWQIRHCLDEIQGMCELTKVDDDGWGLAQYILDTVNRIKDDK